MIDDVDDTLKELLAVKTPLDPGAIDIRFERPDKEWSASVSRPTVNVFLYDVRENHELRSSERYLARNGTTAVESRAPVRIDLSYLITAWTADVADEHQLLGRVLATLLRFPVLPPEVLKGSMQAQPLPPRVWIAQPERMPSPWEFWGHVDHGMKAALCLVLTTSLEPHAATAARLVTSTVLKLAETH
jgi:Pvc16 N-terminal domain